MVSRVIIPFVGVISQMDGLFYKKFARAVKFTPVARYVSSGEGGGESAAQRVKQRGGAWYF